MRRLSLLLLHYLPLLTLLALTLIVFILPGMTKVPPLIILIGVFYFWLYAPLFFSRQHIFFLGLFQDLLYGMPPGLTPLLLIVFTVMMQSQKQELQKQDFLIIWLVFAVMSGIFMLLSGLLMALFWWQQVDYGHVALQWGVSLLLYPLMHRILEILLDYMKQQRHDVYLP